MTNNFKSKQSSGARPPRLSPEEYAAKKKAEKEAVYQMLDDTAAEVVQSPEKFKGYLDVQSRMDRYTANNVLLMYTETGVNYVFHRNGNAAGFTPLLDKDGKPIVTQ